MTESHRLRSMANHDADRSRLVAESVRLDLLAYASHADEAAHLDTIESARAQLYAAEKLCTVLQELRSEIGRLSPEGKAWELTSARLGMWRRVEEYWRGRVDGVGAVGCAECGCPDSLDELREAEGVGRGAMCELCVRQAELVEGLDGL